MIKMNKHISYRSSELLSALNKFDSKFFTLNRAMKILSSSEPDAVRRLLSDMTKRGLILRIKDGLYNVIPFEIDKEKYFPNWHLTAEAMAHPRKFYVGFSSAFEVHGLLTQPSLCEFVVSEKQIVPKIQFVKNIKFEFVTFNSNKFFGYEKFWIDDFHKVSCSDIEKTIIDLLYKPNYSGGFTEILKAIYKSRNKIYPDKLLEYLEKYNTQVVYKRLGFLLQHMDLFTDLRNELQERITNSFALLDPSLPKIGRHNSEWKVLDNVDIISAVNSIQT